MSPLNSASSSYKRVSLAVDEHMTKVFTQNRPGGDLPWGSLCTVNVTIVIQYTCFCACLSQVFAHGNIFIGRIIT